MPSPAWRWQLYWTPRDTMVMLAGLLLGALASFVWLRDPSSYEQCLVEELRSLRGAHQHVAVNWVRDLCNKRFNKQ